MVGIPPPTSSSTTSRVGGGVSQLLRSPPPSSSHRQQVQQQQQQQQRATIITSNATNVSHRHKRTEDESDDMMSSNIDLPLPLESKSVVICGNAHGHTVAASTMSTTSRYNSTKMHQMNECDNIIDNENKYNYAADEEKKEEEEETINGNATATSIHTFTTNIIRNNNYCIDDNDNKRFNDEYGESFQKRTTTSNNVKVCIRLRPMLPSDSSIDTNNNNNAANIGIRNGQIVKKMTAMKRHTSGLITPSSFNTASKLSTTTTTTASSGRRSSVLGENSSIDAQQHSSSAAAATTAMQPAWIAHPNDPHRITQSIHSASTNTNSNNTSSIPTNNTANNNHINNSNNGNNNNNPTIVEYTFDRVYSPHESTLTLYNEHICSIVSNVVKGYHGSVFAYGQTNSGKTFTMTGGGGGGGGGSSSNSGDGSSVGGEQEKREEEMGVIRLAVRDIFYQIQHSQRIHATGASSSSSSSLSSPSREYLVRVSYLEIYNEQLYDLLAPSSSQPALSSSSSMLQQHHHIPSSTAASAIRIFESRTEGVIVRGLREEIVTCPEDVFALLDAGDAKRRVGSTALNKTSSRSHSVFRLVLESRAASSSSGLSTSSSSVANSTSGVEGPVRISSLSLVDLAGSESVKATGSTGLRQKEGQYINKSLLTLGHVVHKLSEVSSRAVGGDGSNSTTNNNITNEHIPYRDSKLTRLLQPSLGGNAQVCIICNVSPALKNVEESHNTLKFAMRAKRIVQHARITEVDKNTLLRSYREEIEELKRQLREARRTAVAPDELREQHLQLHKTPTNKVRHSSFNDEQNEEDGDDDDDDDANVLVSAIANLESLILKAGAKCSSRKANSSTTKSISSSIATTTVGETIDELSTSVTSRALDAVLLKAETSDITVEGVTSDMMSSPGVLSVDSTMNKSCVTTPSAITQPNEDGYEEDPSLLVELHRIQAMLDTVMKKKRRGTYYYGGAKSTPGGGEESINTEYRTPRRDAEIERLRMQLQEQEVTSTMRKADSSFLQSQLNEKEGILQEVAVLLEALEKRQLELENENKQLKNDLADAVHLIEEADAARQLLEKRLSERDGQVAEVKRT
ncbi:hypothetical protein ACHAWU_003611 [Discostella pseudostelligera]|uniref:Kinesin motor domain-containing protein n=1 Tax=Discostella pseudostelligera TaxID=259834 RepID=A0ABD3M456_9STRA